MPGLADWPSVPDGEARPQDLFVAETVPEKELKDLERRGWRVVDVRVLPSKSDGDRVDAVKAWLHGVRVGSIIADPDVIKIIELEARAYGLVGSKQPATRQSEDHANDVIDDLLDFKGVKDMQNKLRGNGFVKLTGKKGKPRLEGIERKPCGKPVNKYYGKPKDPNKKPGRYYGKRTIEPYKTRVNRLAREKREAASVGAGHPITTKFAPRTTDEFAEQHSQIVGE